MAEGRFARDKTEGATWVKLPEDNDVFTHKGAARDGMVVYDPTNLEDDLKGL